MTDINGVQREVTAIDLFCGAGGLSYGLKQAGITIAAGLDIDPACKFPFEYNVGGNFILNDLKATSSAQLSGFFKSSSYSLLAGCAPCQPFSTLSNGRDRRKSPKWPLLKEFERMASDLVPDYITMENVPVLRTQEVFKEFTNNLRDLGYHLVHKILDAADYGVPQRRRRLILLASKHGPIRIATPDEIGVQPRTVRQAISQLKRLEAGQIDPDDPLHRARKINEINVARVRASKPGGTWKDWPEELILECHKRAGGSSFKSVYGRMEWDKPSGTMTTQSYNFGTGRFGHPEQDRAISLREMAILQSFPDHYKFVPDDATAEFASVGRLIGNAVPAGLGYAIGRSIMLSINCREVK